MENPHKKPGTAATAKIILNWHSEREFQNWHWKSRDSPGIEAARAHNYQKYSCFAVTEAKISAWKSWIFASVGITKSGFFAGWARVMDRFFVLSSKCELWIKVEKSIWSARVTARVFLGYRTWNRDRTCWGVRSCNRLLHFCYTFWRYRNREPGVTGKSVLIVTFVTNL